MCWPNRRDYMQAVRDYPHISFQDPKLKGGKPKRLKDGSLSSYSGGFSIVFPIDIGVNTFALRCWAQEVVNAEIRYKKISAYLKQVRLPYFVGFAYVPEGILVNGTKYPITRMDWAEGESLRDFISKNLQNARLFRIVAAEFQKMVATLHRYRIAHGDLQDGNILLKRNGNDVEIKLIDYDGLSVPALHGQPEQIGGLPEYQHPKRKVGGGQTNEKVDYFSELVIYLSFLSLAEKPTLWPKFGDKIRVNHGLLFSEKDFENPNQSSIFRELANLSPDVQQLASTLKDFCAKTSIGQLKPLEAILPKSDANTHSDRGFFFLNSKQYNEARTEFQKAIVINSNYEKAHYGIGLAYLHSAQYTKAISAFQKAIERNSNYKEAHHGLGLTHFRAGDRGKAAAAANTALSIDQYYQPARQLLAAIGSASLLSAKSKPSPIRAKSSSVKPKPNSALNFWQHIIRALRDRWQSFIICIFGLALVICVIAFLTQMDEKGKLISQNAILTNQLVQKESEIDEKSREIQEATSLIQTLKNEKAEFSRQNSELQRQIRSKNLLENTTNREIVSLRAQLNEEETALALQVNENQRLRDQLAKKDTELRIQVSKIKRLQNQKTEIKNEDERLKIQPARPNPGVTRQNTTVQWSQREKAKVLDENRRLRIQNQSLIHQNQKLQGEKKSLQSQLDNAKQNVDMVLPEPPREIDEYKDSATRACVYNNNKGITAFRLKDYDKAVVYFKQAIRADLKFAVTHYNLGCVYLEMREYGEAISALRKVVSINHEFKEAYYNLGIAHLGNGVRKKAKSSAELALRIDENYQRARNLLDIIEKAQR